MRLAVGVMGSSVVVDREVADHAERIGSLIAQKGAVLVTGATTGLPLAAAKGAKRAGGQVIGFSPALNWEEHRNIGLPTDYHDVIVCTGLSFKGRNLLNVRACHGILFLGGSMGVLNEFTIAYDEGKIIGILVGSGGFCNHMKEWIQFLAKPNSRAIIHYEPDPARLTDSVFSSIEATFGK